ncbi:hypothetical protein [Rhizobium leguminosarum]
MATTNSISYDIRSDWWECPVNERCSLFSSLEEANAAHDQEFSQLSDLANWKNADGGTPRGTVDFGKRLSAVMSIRLLVRKYDDKRDYSPWFQGSAYCTVEAMIMLEKTELRVRVLLAVQQSLLGSVGPNLRAVTCSWNSSDIQIRAIFDLAVSETDKENMSEVETEIMSHFPDKEVAVSCARVGAPAIIHTNPNEVFVFKRRE